MEQRPIGTLSVSVVGLGCNQFARKIAMPAAKAVVDAALDVGVNYLDTADKYGYGDLPYSGFGKSEEFLGEALKGRRERVVLATKFGSSPEGGDPRDDGGNRRWVLRACDASLRRLQTDYIDLFQIHKVDPATPIEETLGALNELVDQGKIREFGCSNFPVDRLVEAAEAGATLPKRFVSVQNEYSLLQREPEKGVLQACADNGVAFLPYFPLASGMLTGKYRKGQPPPADGRLVVFEPYRPHLGLSESNLERVEVFSTFAADHGRTLLELAFGWLLAHAEVPSVVAGCTTPEQVRSNAAAAGWVLSAQDLAAVDAL